MIQVRIRDDALEELREQARFYGERESGLGERFIEHVLEAVDVLVEHPNLGVVVAKTRKSGETRVLLIRDFPIRVVYGVTKEVLTVLAIAHTSRHPDYWRKRSRGRR